MFVHCAVMGCYIFAAWRSADNRHYRLRMPRSGGASRIRMPSYNIRLRIPGCERGLQWTDQHSVVRRRVSVGGRIIQLCAAGEYIDQSGWHSPQPVSRLSVRLSVPLSSHPRHPVFT